MTHFSKPGKVFNIADWMFSGKPVENPCTYNSGVSLPSGSIKI